jgi:hypothetical protein
MGRKKMKLFMLVPQGVVKNLGVTADGKALEYKQAHFLSILTHHIQGSFPSTSAFYFKDITSTYLKHHYTTDYFDSVITPLLDCELIEVDDSYSTELHFPKSYRLSNVLIKEVIDGNTTIVYITSKSLIEKIEKWRRTTLSLQVNKLSFIESEADMLLHLNIDTSVLEQLYEQRVADINTSDKPNKKLAITNATRHKEEILKLTEAKDLLDARVRYISGRVYHPFVNCPKEFRKAVVDDEGQSYVEVDLRSSQAVFLCKVIAVALKHRLITFEFREQATAIDNLIEQIIPLLDEPINVLEEGVYPPDFRAFVSAVFFDDIYEDANPQNISQNAYTQVGDEVYLTHSSARLSGAKTLVGEQRDKAKRQFFKDIFFNYYNKENYGVKGQLSISSEYLEHFAKTYYTIYEFCRICASQSKEGKKKSRDLALLLQQTESKFFHELLLAAIQELEPFNYFVVHDAIYIPKKHRVAVIKACNNLSVKFFGVMPEFR